ncbi:MAG: nitronate monooxygenase [Rickettsiales bacterium]|nr:nitronate monooxygenase [Rickettsiales bacterium]|tara:strand:- start:156 stop:1568 length:1413 start_codon:yes stop_codon:yes gene_type:complete
MLKNLNSVLISGKEVLPLIEGGKGVAVSNGISSGSWALAGGVGTFSGVNADDYRKDGSIIRQIYKGKNRKERHQELIDYGIKGGIKQAQIAHEVASGSGRIHINILWEMGGAQKILESILEKTKGLVHGVTCGAGMPYKLAEIASKFNVFYYPIVSSARAFKILFLRAYKNFLPKLGGVVYEDPWLAGGHNGLSNVEDPNRPEDPYQRVSLLRKFMRSVGLDNIPIVMAGGVWHLSEWSDWIDNPELGPVVFQFGTRPLLTKESPIPKAWKERLFTLKKGEIKLHRFSPTGFYSSAVKNKFIYELMSRLDREFSFSSKTNIEEEKKHDFKINLGEKEKTYFINKDNLPNIENFIEQGFTEPLKTPDSTFVMVSKTKAEEIKKDQTDCMGCLSQCKFSSWKDSDKFSTGKLVDPRSFCIQKTLQDIAHENEVENQLMFAGHNAWRFSKDPFYSNKFIPSVKELIDRILTGL